MCAAFRLFSGTETFGDFPRATGSQKPFLGIDSQGYPINSAKVLYGGFESDVTCAHHHPAVNFVNGDLHRREQDGFS
jgi:hypothetical protein